MILPLKNSNLEVLIDRADYDLISDYNWRLLVQKRTGYNLYYVHASYYEKPFKSYDSPKHVYLHRIIMDCPKGYVVDHINGNTLDNRRKNLRVCTSSQNSLNRHRTGIYLRNR